MDLQLTGKNFVMTGATQGLGFAVAQQLAREGANVVVSSRSKEHVDQAVAELGPAASGFVGDVTRDGFARALCAYAEERLGSLAGAFIGHGGPPLGAARDLDDQRLHDAIAIAAVAPIRLLREVTRRLQRGGSVVVLTSISSIRPVPALASSNLTRPAVLGYARTLAAELGPDGIRVNVVMPGRFVTSRIQQLEQFVAEQRGVTAREVRQGDEALIPLRRLGDPAELARVVAFLLSSASSYVTGAACAVDGGVTGL